MLIQFTFRSTSPNQNKNKKKKLIKQTKKKTITVSTASSHTVVNHASQNGVNWMKTKRNKMSKMSPLQNECQNKTARVCVCVSLYAFQKDWTTLVQSLVESGCTLTAQVQVDTKYFLSLLTFCSFWIFSLSFPIFVSLIHADSICFLVLFYWFLFLFCLLAIVSDFLYFNLEVDLELLLRWFFTRLNFVRCFVLAFCSILLV